MSVVATAEERTTPSRVARRTTPTAALAALGIVYGDLGTSPLYTLQTVIQTIGGQFTPEAAIGVLSLILWALVITISVKYCLFVMRADNHGEGGILALMPLAGATGFDRGRALVVMGLFGAALIYGDGIITPAISVLSALEGVNVATDALDPYVMPAAVAILLGLFAAQGRGTARIGKIFGPRAPECAIRIGGEMGAATGFMQYRAGALAADRIIHLMGALAGVVGSAILVGIAAVAADRPTFSASLVYSVCLLTMLGCSAAYNLASNASRREFLRKLDHAAIFLMIAGTYTPFTTCRLNGVWAIGMTAAVWTGAVTGAVIKLICPRGVERGSIVAYLALGWMILVGGRPMLGSVDDRTAILIGVGGVLYSIGVGFHLWRALTFHNAIWHSFVLVAASCHYAAILHGVVLASS